MLLEDVLIHVVVTGIAEDNSGKQHAEQWRQVHHVCDLATCPRARDEQHDRGQVRARGHAEEEIHQAPRHHHARDRRDGVEQRMDLACPRRSRRAAEITSKILYKIYVLYRV